MKFRPPLSELPEHLAHQDGQLRASLLCAVAGFAAEQLGRHDGPADRHRHRGAAADRPRRFDRPFERRQQLAQVSQPRTAGGFPGDRENLPLSARWPGLATPNRWAYCLGMKFASGWHEMARRIRRATDLIVVFGLVGSRIAWAAPRVATRSDAAPAGGPPATETPAGAPTRGALAGAPAAETPPAAPPPANLGLPPAHQITLADALAYARSHQPAVLASLARIETEKANAEVPRAQYYPRLGLTAQLLEGTTNNTTASYLGAAFVDLPRIGGTTATSGSDARWKPYASTLAAAGLSQEIFDFGRIAAESAAADARVTIAARAADAQRLDIELNVEEAFFAVHAARSILQASEDAYQRSLVHRNYAGAGVKSGLRSPIELTRAEADLSRFDTGRIRARGGVSVAQTVLAAAVGSTDLVLDAADDAPGSVVLPALAEAIRLASEHDPSLQEALARLRQQELETRAVGALARPDLRLSATVSGRAHRP